MGIEGPGPGYIMSYLFSQAFSLEVRGRDTENDNHLMWKVSGRRCGCVSVFYIQGLSFSHSWFRNPILAVFTTSSNNTINTVIALWLHFSVIDLFSFSIYSRVPLQIYAQRDSQRSGYIELALQAYEQTAVEGSASWLVHTSIEKCYTERLEILPLMYKIWQFVVFVLGQE